MAKITASEVEEIKAWLGTGSINIFGLPSSGKDIHGNWLAGMLGAVIVNGGDIVRTSKLPTSAQQAIDNGEFIPSDDYLDIVLPYFTKKKAAGKPLILTTLGRWHGEEDRVMAAAESSGHPIKAVIYLDISPSVARKRFDSMRLANHTGKDIREDRLAMRFHEFTSKTLPVLAYYEQKDLLIDIDGNPPVNEVRQELLKHLLVRARLEQS